MGTTFNQYYGEILIILNEIKKKLQKNKINDALKISEKLNDDKYVNVFAGAPELRRQHYRLLKELAKRIAENE